MAEDNKSSGGGGNFIQNIVFALVWWKLYLWFGGVMSVAGFSAGAALSSFLVAIPATICVWFAIITILAACGLSIYGILALLAVSVVGVFSCFGSVLARPIQRRKQRAALLAQQKSEKATREAKARKLAEQELERDLTIAHAKEIIAADFPTKLNEEIQDTNTIRLKRRI